ncbi:hypothetical protein [Hymenobacter crusticola]|uniref:Uncharacterized protein n=1 Tax=Hymenobacter crusticola TaxID=1770526 RepID=A0A243W9Z6_9BACT|nr:hypothetical protein [Hymenobacter crusticola]OUJ72355.1 hypothetical protein BXP70_19070 [Hymenobacter crusticola]
MAAQALLTRLRALGQALEEATDTGDVGSSSPLHQAREFLLTHLPQEPSLPYRADDLLEELAPSPHIHLRWEEERELVLEGLGMLHYLWQRQLTS